MMPSTAPSIAVTRSAFALAAAWLAGGCAGVPAVPKEIVAVFPEIGRRWVFEAENEVLVALDRVDQATDRLAVLDEALEGSRRGGSAEEVFDAKRTWLQEDKEGAKSELAHRTVAVRCARANLELTKARAALRFALPVDDGFLAPFLEASLACEENLERARAAVDEGRRRTMLAKQRWREVREAYAERTGDHDHGLWID